MEHYYSWPKIWFLDGVLLERKQYTTYIQPIDVRLEAVRDFLMSFRPETGISGKFMMILQRESMFSFY